MSIPPIGNGGGRNVRFMVIPGEKDARIPTLMGMNPGVFGLMPLVNFTQKADYLNNTVARHVGEAKDPADLGKLALGWAAELFGFRPNDNVYTALILKGQNGELKVKSSSGAIDETALGLDSPNSLISYALRAGVVSYFPNVLQHEPNGNREFRYLDGDISTGIPHTRVGIEVEPLARIGVDKPCFLAAPLKKGDEIEGVLFMAVGAGMHFGREPEDMIIARELASNIAFGIRLLKQKGHSF